MLPSDIINRASIIAGTHGYSGVETDLNEYALNIKILENTINDLNGDTALSLIQETFDYQHQYNFTKEGLATGTSNNWFNFVIG